MKVLYRSDTDYIVLPSKDPFVQMQQPFLIEMGYRLIEDWVPPGCTDEDLHSGDSVLSSSSASQTSTEEASTQETEETFTTASGKTVTKSELEALLKNL